MAQYFENDPTLLSKEFKFNTTIQDVFLTFYSNRGVFSKSSLDFGTRLLLEQIDFLKGRVLDFGCGYGPIGIFLKKKFPIEVDMIDINKRCLHLALKNAKENKVSVNIFESNIYENIKDEYDFIVTNPPIRVGKKILYDILLGAYDHLKKEGILFFVIHKDQGAKSVLKDLSQVYKTEVLIKDKGFFVIKCSKILTS